MISDSTNAGLFCDYDGQALLFRHALVRLAGLPTNAVDVLRCPRTMALIAECAEIERSRFALSELLLERLHAYIGLLDDQPKRRLEVIHLKRTIFNQRLTSVPSDLLEDISRSDFTLAQDIRTWLDLTAGVELRRADGELSFQQELRASQEALKDILRQPLFRSGLDLANPLLSRNLDKLLNSSGSMSRRARVAERSVLSYVHRTAYKTSPFSTFTIVAHGILGTADTEEFNVAACAATLNSFPAINVGILAHLAYRLEDVPHIVKELTVSLTTAWTRSNNHIRYLRNIVSVAHGDGPVEMTVNHHFFTLTSNALIDQLIALLDEQQRLPMKVLAELLANRMGISADAIFPVLQRLLKLNFLVADSLRLGSGATSLNTFCDALEAFPDEDSRDMVATLRTVSGLLSQSSFSPFSQRHATLSDISAKLSHAYKQVQLPPSMLPKSLVYEDVAYFPQGGTVKLPSVDDHINDLALLQRLLPLFNRYHWLRAGMTGYFVTKFGPSGRANDIQSFAMDFFAEYQGRFWENEWANNQKTGSSFIHNYFHSTVLDRIQSARVALADYIHQLVTSARNPDHIDLDPLTLKSILSTLGHEGFLSNSLFLQISRRGADFDLVLNKAYSGLGQMFSRFSSALSEHSDASLLSSLREMILSLQPPNTLFAEIRGGVDTNLNLHPSLCKYAIAFPGEARDVAGQVGITLDDLFLEHNHAQNRLMLCSHRLQCEIIPVYHGFLVPGALPTIHKVLLNLSPLYLGDNSLASLSGLTSQDTPAVIPRIMLGNLVLDRKSWHFSASHLPVAEPGESEFGYCAAVYRWRQQHSIPERAFIRVLAEDATVDADAKEDEVKFSQKPSYVDFGSILSLQQFQRATMKFTPHHRLIVTEMLPYPVGSSSQGTSSSFVGELVLDLNQVGGDTP
jgi:hypothetical protein